MLHWTLVGLAAPLVVSAAISVFIAAGSVLPGSMSVLTGRPAVAPLNMDASGFANAIEWNRRAEAFDLSEDDWKTFNREVPKFREMAQDVWEDGAQRGLEALAAALGFLSGALAVSLIGRAIRYVTAGE